MPKKTSHQDEPFQREFQWEKPILDNLVNLCGLKVWCHEFIWIQVFSWKKSRMKHVIEVHWMNVHLKSNESNTFSEILAQLFRSSAIGCIYIYIFIAMIPLSCHFSSVQKNGCLLNKRVHRERKIHHFYALCFFQPNRTSIQVRMVKWSIHSQGSIFSAENRPQLPQKGKDGLLNQHFFQVFFCC